MSKERESTLPGEFVSLRYQRLHPTPCPIVGDRREVAISINNRIGLRSREASD
jgi:hypothetical protein